MGCRVLWGAGSKICCCYLRIPIGSLPLYHYQSAWHASAPAWWNVICIMPCWPREWAGTGWSYMALGNTSLATCLSAGKSQRHPISNTKAGCCLQVISHARRPGLACLKKPMKLCAAASPAGPAGKTLEAYWEPSAAGWCGPSPGPVTYARTRVTPPATC